MREPSCAENCSAVILSGGLNSRMGGRNKAFLEVGGQTILQRLMNTLAPTFTEILLVTRTPEAYAHIPVKVVRDLYEDRSSLTGIHAGLVNARTDHALMVPSDAPFVQPAVIDLLLDELHPEMDVVVPTLDGYYQPLCAIYSKRCIPMIEAQLHQEDYKIINFFPQVRVNAVPARRIKAADPELLTFMNINTPSAYSECQKIAGNRMGSPEGTQS